jgi:hypothetical protein
VGNCYMPPANADGETEQRGQCPIIVNYCNCICRYQPCWSPSLKCFYLVVVYTAAHVMSMYKTSIDKESITGLWSGGII